MGYQSLKIPQEDTPDDSDNSIQGSPLLDTGAKFASNSLDNSYNPAFDVEPKSPYEMRYEPTEYEQALQDSPYDDYAEDYGVTYESGYTSVLPGSPGTEYRLKPGLSSPVQLPHENKLPGHMEPLIEHQDKELNDDSVHSQSQNATEKTNVEETATGSSSLSSTASTGLTRWSINQGNGAIPRSPTTIRASIRSRNRMSLPVRLSSPVDHSLTLEEPKHAESSLNFEGKTTRPKSTLIRSTFNETKSQVQDDDNDDDDDALPFETTKRMAWQGRPQSMVQLSQLERGPVMSKETFENYRKSLSTLDTLKHMNSRGSFRKNSLRRKKATTGGTNINPVKDEEGSEEGGDYDDNGDLDDLEDEEAIHEKERKRKSALLRQEQDARMSIYRQKMTKMTGGSLEPSTTIDSRVPLEGEDGKHGDDNENNEMMDDIPLSILQAHGFPKARPAASSRPPSRPTSYHSAVQGNRPSSLHESLLSNGRSQHMTSPVPLSSSRMSTSTSRMSMSHLASPGHTPSSPAPPNGNRSSWNLPDVFGNKNNMLSRGLVAEIAKEEEYRRRRHTIGFDNALSLEHSGIKQGEASSITSSGAHSNELQAKLDQVLDMLSKISTNEQTMQQKHMHSPGIQSVGHFSVPTHANHRAPSIRSSYTARTSQSSISQPSKWVSPYVWQRQSLSPGMVSPAAQFLPMGHPPSQGDAANPQDYTARGRHQVRNRPSRMRLIKDGDEEEDDDTEWEKLNQKRQELRNQWKSQEEVPSA